MNKIINISKGICFLPCCSCLSKYRENYNDFWKIFKEVATNPVGRTLLYRILIEIFRVDSKGYHVEQGKSTNFVKNLMECIKSKILGSIRMNILSLSVENVNTGGYEFVNDGTPLFGSTDTAKCFIVTRNNANNVQSIGSLETNNTENCQQSQQKYTQSPKYCSVHGSVLSPGDMPGPAIRLCSGMLRPAEQHFGD
jgi:hypothetical protein